MFRNFNMIDDHAYPLSFKSKYMLLWYSILPYLQSSFSLSQTF